MEASIALYQKDKKIFETDPVRVSRLSEKRPGTLPIWLQLPASKLQLGRYDCQINLIDEFGRKFAFPRTVLAVLSTTPEKPVALQLPISTSTPAPIRTRNSLGVA